jgi:acyl-CoA synthetase (NDP forming)
MMHQSEVAKLIELSLESGTGVLTEDTAKKILSAFHVPVVPEICVLKAEETGPAARATGFPVVLKAMGATILHKTESGFVRVGLSSEDAVTHAAMEMVLSEKEEIDTFIIQPQVAGKREFVAGMFKDSQFGAVIMFGLGGIFTEAVNDTVFKVAPLSDIDMNAMLDELRSKKLLGDFRGEKSVDKKALKQILKGLSDLVTQFPEIKEVDINPIIIKPDGNPVAVDALIITERVKEPKRKIPRINPNMLRYCYYPESVAFIGASGTLSKWGHMLVTNILNRDYKGRVYLVNPRGGIIVGQKAYPSIVDIQENVDLAVVTIPASKVIELIPQLKQKRVKAMLLITSGFRETGDAGARLEEDLVREAEKAGILIFGPNTMGICNPHINFFCSGVHVYPLAGSTSLVCQSGNMGTQLLAFAEQQDIGIRAFSGSGNEAMVTMEDYLEAFEIDDLTRIVVLYIESIKDGSRFFKSASRLSKKKPVVVLKGGRTEKGGKAAASHTGAMASNSRVFKAACRQAGIIQVQKPLELLDLSAVFSSLPLPKGNRVAIMTLGGGWGVITTDLCMEHELSVPDLSTSIIEKLNRILPSYWSHGNPIDIVGEGDPAIPKTTLDELLKWEGCDAVIHLGIHGKRILASKMLDSILNTDPAYSAKEIDGIKKMVIQIENDYIRHVVELTERYEKPILGVSLLTDEETRTLYRIDGCKYQGVFFPSPERAVKALSGMCRYQRWLREYR